ncbi:hypothetical protein M409DRAFT_52174 [Zasmidium cellare ATCC 36951]|uniref:Amino acid permease/ SLC12A domain-containing protein n=1 Tax=Zasmidium cellare ATCC 36951 TaxID=1080233 RepID=A0A6A6CVY1_ZASCE|nr:uncharacterized protein M409DRAFT_52174 [Zasmidium cellare ATCC 36951]KAF2169656.1 hypothetical protein M409DRAFT_52174 [Zasmidium cellare ATCC 36951]
MTIDDAELLAQGYVRAMPRRFTLLTLTSLSFTLTCTWLGTATSLGIALTEASSAGVLYSLVIAGVFTAILSYGTAELASAFPVAGAQYYWAFVVSAPEWAPWASFVTGWVNVWVVWLNVGWNSLGGRWIPAWNQFLMFFGLVVIVASFVTLLVCSRNHYSSAEWIFTDTTNSTGWPSTGFAFMLATMNGIFAYAGTDCGAHLAEEIPSPSRNVPKVIMWPILIGFVVAWPLAVAMMASIYDLEAVLTTPTGFPLIEVLYQGTGGSRAVATVFMALYALALFGCCAANGTTNARILWAISRDGAVPVNAMLLSGVVVTLYGLIFIGSATVFSSMISALIVFLQTSCALPQAILLFRGRSKVLPPRYFRIAEPWGYLTNAIAVAWVLFTDVLACIPVSYPVTLENMNWISVVTVALVSFILLLWVFDKRKRFRGPKVDFELMRIRREEALGLLVENRVEGDVHVRGEKQS